MSLALTVQPYAARLGRRMRNAQRSWSERAGLLVTLNGDGIFGQGEAAPLPGGSPESLANVEAELSTLDTAALSRLAGLGVADPARFLEELAGFGPSYSSASRFAFETALCDWVARRRGEPLHRFLGQACAFRLRQEAVPVAALVDPESPASTYEALFRQGFTALKLKVGILPAPAESRVVAELRAEFGASLKLRLDANRAWTTDVARERLTAFAPHGIEFIEEPTLRGERLTSPAVPVALDESLPEASTWSAAELLARGVRVWVLKPTLVGGVIGTLSLARSAASRGFAVVISHAFEGPVAFAALTELALALGSSLAQGLGPHAALEGWASPLPAGHRGTRIEAHDGLGLGLPGVLTVPGLA